MVVPESSVVKKKGGQKHVRGEKKGKGEKRQETKRENGGRRVPRALEQQYCSSTRRRRRDACKGACSMHEEDDIPDETKKKIRELWRKPGFPGAFTGLSNFRATLALDKNIHLSRIKLFHIMQDDEDFILETKRKRKQIPRRPLVVHGVASVWQADIGEMFTFNKFKSFLCCVDFFSRRIFCHLLETKSAKEVRLAFKKIFKEAGMRPQTLETDRGTEFLANRNFFRNHQIFHKIKIGKNKAAFAEHAIQVRKRTRGHAP